jgi:hypothetical protein
MFPVWPMSTTETSEEKAERHQVQLVSLTVDLQRYMRRYTSVQDIAAALLDKYDIMPRGATQ